MRLLRSVLGSDNPKANNATKALYLKVLDFTHFLPPTHRKLGESKPNKNTEGWLRQVHEILTCIRPYLDLTSGGALVI